MATSFWLENPMVLIKQDSYTQLWPNEDMTFEEKLNAITRLVVVLTTLGFLMNKSKRMIITGLITIMIIIVLYKIKGDKKESYINLLDNIKKSIKQAEGENTNNLDSYTRPNKKNPAMNVLVNEHLDDPDRKKAAPAYNPTIEKEMNDTTKEFVTGQFNDTTIDKKLFNDIGDHFEFDRSMHTWYATPNTTIPNDQKSFANFCYGDMKDSKKDEYLDATED